MSTKNLNLKNSEILKGILMLLIILGHNHIIAPGGGALFNYVYSFHIYGFFILPFLYNKNDKFNKENILKVIIRNWVPYFVFFTACYFIYHFIVLTDSVQGFKFVIGLLNGGATATKDTVGFIYLWFMPAYAAMSIVKMMYDNGSVYVKSLIIGISIGLNISIPFTFNTVFDIVPLAISQGFYYLGFGLITKILLDKIPSVKYISAVVFIFISLLYWLQLHDTFRLLFAVSGFLFLLSIVDLLAKIPYLYLIGKYSFPIYLVHVIVYNVLEIIFPKTLLFGFIDFALTITISLGIAYIMTEISIIRKLVMPRNWEELRSFYKRA